MEYVSMQIDTSSKQHLKDVLNIIGFILAVVIGAWMINMFVFRSFNVSGPSMEDTLHTNDRLIVNRLPVTWDSIRGRSYVPNRGDIIVFRNPQFGVNALHDEYIVKRVIAFPGEYVELTNGRFTVYSDAQKHNPIDVDKEHPGAKYPTEGEVHMEVQEGQIFVAGDNRNGGHSYDSRNGLGTVPFASIIGPVAVRIYPFEQMRLF
jgi:signal peptidase I